MKPWILALVAGGLATALPAGSAAAADPPVAAVAPVPADAGAAAPSLATSGDNSRYRFYNGYWWYWQDNRWLCYMNGQWVNPTPPPAQAGVSVQAAAPVYMVPQPYYGPYPYGYYDYPYSYYGGGGIFIGGG